MKLVIRSFDLMGTEQLRPTDGVISIVTRKLQERPDNLTQHARVCRVAFADFGGDVQRMLVKRSPSFTAYCPMTQDDARAIFDFVVSMTDVRHVTPTNEMTRCFVHCEAGVSRSPAVAFALAAVFGWEPSAHDIVQLYPCMNMHVVNTMLTTWQRIHHAFDGTEPEPIF